jgi:hypothetical protein
MSSLWDNFFSNGTIMAYLAYRAGMRDTNLDKKQPPERDGEEAEHDLLS